MKLTTLNCKKSVNIFIKYIINIAVRKVFVLDRIENLFSYYRAREIVTGTAEKHYNRALSLIIEANNTKELKAFEKEAIEEIKKTKIDVNRDVLTVDITGEIFLVQEPFSTQNIEKELGRMGVQTRKARFISSRNYFANLKNFLYLLYNNSIPW